MSTVIKVKHYDAHGGELLAPLPSEDQAEEKQLGTQLRAWGGGWDPSNARLYPVGSGGGPWKLLISNNTLIGYSGRIMW